MESMNLVIPLVNETDRNSIFLYSHSTIYIILFSVVCFKSSNGLVVRVRLNEHGVSILNSSKGHR